MACFSLGGHFVWDVGELMSSLAGRRGIVFNGCAFRLGGARVAVNF